MQPLRRRQLLGGFGALAATGTLAGCLGETPNDADGGQNDHDFVRENAVVDYPGLVDDEASVSGDERTITYADPEATFVLGTSVEGSSPDGPGLRARRDLSGEAMAGFVGPAYDADNDRFDYHVFANEAFVDHADWNLIVVPSGGEPTPYDWSGFDRLQGTVHGTTVEPDGSVRAVLVADAPAEDLAMNGGSAATGLSLTRDTDENVSSSAPNARFDFEYDADAERLSVTHEVGDSVRAERLSFQSRGDVEVVETFDGTVAAGDTATLSVTGDVTVSLVWESEDGTQSSTMARWENSDS